MPTAHLEFYANAAKTRYHWSIPRVCPLDWEHRHDDEEYPWHGSRQAPRPPHSP